MGSVRSVAVLDGRVAVVTGAAGGIGSAVAACLADAGATLVLADRNAGGLSSVGPPDAVRVAGDVTLRAGAEAVFAAAPAPPSILVNAVGGMRGPLYRSFMSLTDEQWDFSMRLNLRSTFLCMQEALKVMVPAGAGSIVNIASTSWAGAARHPDYAAAKAAVVSLTRAVATEVGPSGVRVNAVAPGMTMTAPVVASSDLMAEVADVPLGRLNEPDDVARAVRYLCSDDARNVTGQLLTVAGGLNPSL